jgi:RimJ/RimL family protein N-acetyltransferase
MARSGLKGITSPSQGNDLFADFIDREIIMTTKDPPFLLETNRLIIRSFRDDDLDTFLAYRNEPDVARYQGWDIPYPHKKAIEFIDEMKNKNPSKPEDWYQAAIIIKGNGEFIGDAAFFIKKDENRKAYIGCTIMQKYWRKGYGMEATRRLLSYLFDEHKIHRVVAETDVKNIASYTTLERLGFRREAHLIENIWFKGSWASEYHYAILEREWETLKST